MPVLLFPILALLAAGPIAPSPAPQASPLVTAIGRLGAFDFPVRTEAARLVRRAPAASSSPLLQDAVRRHPDEYVRFRAFVLLAGIDPAAADRVAGEVLADRNDRVRTVAYQWFEHHPRPDILPQLLKALPSEQSEFVRPALTRAIAAAEPDPRVQAALGPLVMRGEDLFRGSVIAALGDYHGRHALADITTVAELDGPLQDDAITALGRLGDASSRAVLGRLQQQVQRDMQPTVSAALCLLGIDCDARLAYLTSTLAFAAGSEDYQPLLRGTVHALGVLAVAGKTQALTALVDEGLKRGESARAPIALGLGLVALRNPTLVIGEFAGRKDIGGPAGLLRDAFDMLSDEDFEEERFATALRQALSRSPTGSAQRRVAEALLTELEY
jgi:hypothetical protein